MDRYLLIDDIAGRAEAYRKFFDFLEIEYLEDKSHLDRLNLASFSGFILDVLYSDPSYKDITFDYVVNKLPPNKPIYIVSADWQQVMHEKKNEKISQFLRNGQILAILSWETIQTEMSNNLTSSKDYAKTSWIIHNDLCDDRIADDESILLLQISDLEFGSPHQNAFINVAREDILNEIRRDMKLFDNKRHVDFLIICGDITHNGEKGQFNDAREWIKTFSGEVIREGSDKNRRIMVVPGNHDVDLSSLLGNYKSILYDDNKKCFEIKNNDPVKTSYNHLGLNNFAHFLRELTDDDSMLIDPNRPTICRRFENAGINFILLNSIRFSEDMRFKYELDDKYISDIQEEVRNMNPDVCNIIVSHTAHNRINVSDPTSDATHPVIKSLVSAIQPKLWLFGHAHDEIMIDDRKIGDEDGKTCLARARALMLRSTGVCDGASSGYTLLNLKRQGGKVFELEYLSFDKTKGRVKKSITTPFTSW